MIFKKIKKSFGIKLSMTVMLVVNSFFIISIAVIAVLSHLIISDEATKSARNLLQANLNEIETEISNVETQVQLFSTETCKHLYNRDELYAQTADFLSRSKGIMGTAIAFRDGWFNGEHFFSPYSYIDDSLSIHTIQLGNENYDYFSMEWYTSPVSTGEASWCEPYFDEGGGQKLMSTYSLPLKDDKGEIFAVMTADVSLENIAVRMSRIKPYKDSYTLLVSTRGRMLSYEKDPRFMGKTLREIVSKSDDDNVSRIVDEMLSGKSGADSFFNGREMYMAVYGHLSNGWSAVTICPYREVLRHTSIMHLILILLGLIGMAIVFVLCFLTVRKMTKPLEQFSVSAMQMSTGDFNAQLPEINSGDEIQQLRDSFEYMQHSIVDYMENLKKSTAANERIESELNIARQIQQDMLPHEFPDNRHVDLSAKLLPAKEVGGDLYDFLMTEKSLLFAVGDVSGKGVPASLIMALTKSAWSFVADRDKGMDSLMSKVNRFVEANNATGNFVTLFIGRYSLESHILEYCNAGHNPLIVSTADGQTRFLKAKPNIAIGLFPDFTYQSESLELPSGSRLLLYTDGVTEAEDKDKNLFGEERLMSAFKASLSRGDNSSQTVEAILGSVKEFTAQNPQNDDITLMSIALR